MTWGVFGGLLRGGLGGIIQNVGAGDAALGWGVWGEFGALGVNLGLFGVNLGLFGEFGALRGGWL